MPGGSGLSPFSLVLRFRVLNLFSRVQNSQTDRTNRTDGCRLLQSLAFREEHGKGVPGVFIGEHLAVGHFQTTEQIAVRGLERLEASQVFLTNSCGANRA